MINQITSKSISTPDFLSRQIKQASSENETAITDTLELQTKDSSSPENKDLQKQENKTTLKQAALKFLKKSYETADRFKHSLKAFPSFIYPTVANATEAEHAFVYNTLDTLPLKDAASTSHIQFFDKLTLLYDTTEEASGMAFPFPGGHIIGLSKPCIDSFDEIAKEVIIHETGHIKDYQKGFISILGESARKIWGEGPHVSEYAEQNMLEDFAESYAKYRTDPELLKTECPEKYAEMERLDKNGSLEALVENNSAFRETGRYIGNMLSKVPYLKQGLNIASSVIGAYKTIKGHKELREGLKSGDELKQMKGSMKFMSGLCYASKLFAVGGLAIDGAEQALSRAIEKKEITPEEANYVAAHSTSIPTKAVIKVGKWVNKVFHKITGKKTQEKDTPEIKKPKIKLKDAKKAIAVAIGGAAGSVSGSMLGVYAGVTAGFAIGGPLGGAIGLVVGGFLGNSLMTKLGGVAGTKIGNLIQPSKTEPEIQEKQKAEEKSSNIDP